MWINDCLFFLYINLYVAPLLNFCLNFLSNKTILRQKMYKVVVAIQRYNQSYLLRAEVYFQNL
jgi:hypothetical protein